MSARQPDLELLQFRYSPYNEKARWALAYKGLEHARRSLLPGPHAGPVRKLTGQTATPVLVIDGEPVAGSARVIDALDRLAPEPRLVPEDDGERARALAIQARFDDDLTPRMRCAVLAILIDEPGYMCRCFAGGAPPFKRAVYRAAVPFARRKIARGNGIDSPASVEDGRKATQEAFDFVAAETAATGYLVGGRFTVADLTAAATLATCIDPPDSDMERPTPHPRGLADWLAAWQGHPGAAWVLEVYRKHRTVDRITNEAVA